MNSIGSDEAKLEIASILERERSDTRPLIDRVN